MNKEEDKIEHFSNPIPSFICCIICLILCIVIVIVFINFYTSYQRYNLASQAMQSGHTGVAAAVLAPEIGRGIGSAASGVGYEFNAAAPSQ